MTRCMGEDRRCMGEDRRCMGGDRRCMGGDRRCMSEDRRCMSEDRRCMGGDRRCSRAAAPVTSVGHGTAGMIKPLCLHHTQCTEEPRGRWSAREREEDRCAISKGRDWLPVWYGSTTLGCLPQC